MRLGERSNKGQVFAPLSSNGGDKAKHTNSNRCRRTRRQKTARRRGAEINRAQGRGVIQRSQVTCEATLTTRATASIENGASLHLAPPLQALEPNAGDHLEGNVEMRGCT